MTTSQRHHGFDFRTRKRTAQDGHGALTVDDRSHAKFFVNVSAFSEAADFCGVFARRQHSFAEKLLRAQHRAGNSTEAAHESSSRPFQVECHRKAPFLWFTSSRLRRCRCFSPKHSPAKSSP